MEHLQYIIWHVRPEIFGNLTIRWYGLLFAAGFVIGQFIMSKIFQVEGKSQNDLEKLVIYVVVATIIGARLGHCFFYEPAYFLANPLEILFIWKGGLASHGAAIALIIAIYLYSRKRKKDQSFWWVIDRLVILVALGGSFIRFGNLMNSEIIGKPSNASYAFVFTYGLQERLSEDENKTIRSIKPISLNKDTTVNGTTYTALKLSIHFRKNKIEEEQVKNYIEQHIVSRFPKNINGKVTESMHYMQFQKPEITVTKESGAFIAHIEGGVYGIPRHPAQLYESISCLILFLILLLVYFRLKSRTPQGLFFGIFMIYIFTLRFFYEFLKENQVAFENDMALNMGQILSIPAVLIGVAALFFAARNAKKMKEKQGDR